MEYIAFVISMTSQHYIRYIWLANCNEHELCGYCMMMLFINALFNNWIICSFVF